MKKKIPETITVEIPVDMLREEAVAYMSDSLNNADIHPDIFPGYEELESRFNKNILNPNFIKHIQARAKDIVILDLNAIFQDHYEEEYIQDLIRKTIALDIKEKEQHEDKRLKHIESAMAKLTPEEREALGLKS